MNKKRETYSKNVKLYINSFTLNKTEKKKLYQENIFMSIDDFKEKK